MLSRDCEGTEPGCLVLEFDDVGEPALAEGEAGTAGTGAFSVVRTRVEDCVGVP